MKITREKLVAMYQCFTRLSHEKTSVKFHYTILKNKRLVEPEVKTLEEASKPLPEYEDFDKKRLEMCDSFCEKGDDGKPLVKNRNFVIPEEVREEFDGKLEALKEENKTVFDEMEKRQEQFNELLNGEVDIELVPVKLSIMPEELLGADVEVLMDIIDED